jgi:hypothetical protein
MANKKNKTETIRLGDKFNVVFINDNPPRLEAKLDFDRTSISQKFIFTMMQISHFHGFSCSSPIFHKSENDDEAKMMSFLIGTVVTSRKTMVKHLQRMYSCLMDFFEFAESFSDQLDFSKLDLSMFKGVVVGDVERVAAIRDQNYEGSWENLYNSIKKIGLDDAAEIIVILKKFEDVNGKDIGYVGHKLNYMLSSYYLDKKDSVLN